MPSKQSTKLSISCMIWYKTALESAANNDRVTVSRFIRSAIDEKLANYPTAQAIIVREELRKSREKRQRANAQLNKKHVRRQEALAYEKQLLANARALEGMAKNRVKAHGYDPDYVAPVIEEPDPVVKLTAEQEWKALARAAKKSGGEIGWMDSKKQLRYDNPFKGDEPILEYVESNESRQSAVVGGDGDGGDAEVWLGVD